MCVEHIPSPVDNAGRKVEHTYTGPSDSDLAEELFQCQADVSLHLLDSVHNSGIFVGLFACVVSFVSLWLFCCWFFWGGCCICFVYLSGVVHIYTKI